MASLRRSERRSAPAVVVGIDCVTGLQTARLLARRGVPVVGVAFRRTHPCARTRVCERVVAAPRGGEELIRALGKLGPTLATRAVLYPCDDASVLLVSRHREELRPWYHIPLAAASIVETLADKVGFMRCAQEADIPIPRTLLLRDRDDAVQAAEVLTFPCVVKPSLRTLDWHHTIGLKVIRIDHPDDLAAAYEGCAPFAESLIVQQWIEGGDAELFSCNGYFAGDGEPLVTFVARKVRQWPPHIGVSSLGVECRNDVVRELALRLFRSVGFHGLGYLEVKRDLRTGEHFAIEANVGRPTGRSAIAEAGGVELLYTMYCDALDLPLPAEREQRYGNAKWIYWRQDLRSAFHYWRAGELSLRAWAESWRGPKATAVFSWTDPLPFVADLARAAGRARRERTRSGEPWPVSGPVPAERGGPHAGLRAAVMPERE